MSRHSDSLVVDGPVPIAEEVCRRAVAELGWRVLESGAGRLVTKEVSPRSTSFTWSAKVEIRIEDTEGHSEIHLQGSITGMGPVQKGHLKGQVGALRNQIEVAADSLPQGGAPSAGVGDLERLAALHASGALTDEEFDTAKRRALEA